MLLVIGLGSALVIYLTAQPVFVDPLIGDPFATKKYVRELRVMGGKENLLIVEFIGWFMGLWHGQNLAGTVAALTVAVTLAFRFVASLPDPAAPGSAQAKSPPRGHS